MPGGGGGGGGGSGGRPSASTPGIRTAGRGGGNGPGGGGRRRLSTPGGRPSNPGPSSLPLPQAGGSISLVPWGSPLPAPAPAPAPRTRPRPRSPPPRYLNCIYSASCSSYPYAACCQTDSGGESSKSISSGAIAGIVIGVVVFVMLALTCVMWRKQSSRDRAARLAPGAGSSSSRTLQAWSASSVAPAPAPTDSRVVLFLAGLSLPAAGRGPHKLDAAAIQALPMFEYRRQKSVTESGAGGQAGVPSDSQGVLPDVQGDQSSVAPDAAALAAAKKSKSRDGECPVCLGELQEGDMVRMLPHCLHLFHPDCIDPWLLEQPSCPICRLPVQVSR